VNRINYSQFQAYSAVTGATGQQVTALIESPDPGGGGLLPYMGYMCGPKGYGFSAVWS